MQLDLPLNAADPPAATPVSTDVVFVRRRGARRYILRVLDDGTVRVTVPWWGRKAEAARFLASQHEWIERQRATRASVPDRAWRSGADVLLDGVAHLLHVKTGDRGAIVSCGEHTIGEFALAGGDARPVVEAWLKRRARATLPGELAILAERHGIAVARVAVRNQQSRWGSCSRAGTVSLNWRLVQVPPRVREYVLVHELMHCREMNHSARFWRLVAATCPDYVEARRWLRTEGMRLF